MSVRYFEVAATLAVGGDERTLTKRYACQPRGYACFGGDWYPQFSPQGLAFEVELPDGSLSLPAPMCESSYGVGTDWADLREWPVSERFVDGDTYVFSASELQMASAEKIAGTRVMRYQIRQIATEQAPTGK